MVDPDGLRPDFNSRFFVEDVPDGLVIVKGVAEIAGVETPMLDRVLSWCQGHMSKEYLVGDRLRGRDCRPAGLWYQRSIHLG